MPDLFVNVHARQSAALPIYKNIRKSKIYIAITFDYKKTKKSLLEQKKALSLSSSFFYIFSHYLKKTPNNKS